MEQRNAARSISICSRPRMLPWRTKSKRQRTMNRKPLGDIGSNAQIAEIIARNPGKFTDRDNFAFLSYDFDALAPAEHEPAVGMAESTPAPADHGPAIATVESTPEPEMESSDGGVRRITYTGGGNCSRAILPETLSDLHTAPRRTGPIARTKILGL